MFYKKIDMLVDGEGRLYLFLAAFVNETCCCCIKDANKLVCPPASFVMSTFGYFVFIGAISKSKNHTALDIKNINIHM